MIRPEMFCPSWEIKPLGEVVDFLDHLRRPITERDRKKGPYPYYGANGQQDSVADYIFNEPLILLAEDGGYFGDPEKTIAYRVEGKYWVNNHAHVLRPKNDVDIGFLCRQLERYDVTPFINGATRQKLTKTSASEIPITLPLLVEQKRIAVILDMAEAIRRKRVQAIKLADDFLRATFLDMFGDPVTNLKGWEVKMFGEIGTLDRGVSKHRPRNAPELLGGPYPLIQTGDVANSGGYIRKYKTTYSEIGLKQSKIWPKGTLCITIAANIAKTAILTFDACFPDSVVGFTPNSLSTTEYVQFWLGFHQKILEEKAPESAQKNINLNILRILDVPLPPIDLQKTFSLQVGKIESLKEKQTLNNDYSSNLFNSLAQRAFRGEL